MSSLAARLHGSAVIAAYMRGQRRVPFMPREKLHALRDARIRRIVAYAARTVPYYRDLFARERVDARDVRGAADLDRLPTIEREVVRQNPHLFISEARPSRTALSFLTSGSTGIPLEVHHDRRSMLANIAFGERERAPVNRICGGSFRPKELYVGYETSTFKKVIAFYEQSTLQPMRPRRRFVPLHEPIDKIAEIANAEKPDVLVGYGGWIDLFFKTVVARDIEIHVPKAVMYMGEALPPGARSHIEEHFGIPVLSRYNAVESFKIGYFCDALTGFHVHEDICHVRVVGPDGTAVAGGEHGELVISNLINRASVLLNYPIGDVASLSDRPCPCGRTFRLMSELEGRVEDILLLPDGRFVHPREIWQVFKPDREVLQYQVIQHPADRYEIFLATVDEPAFARARDRALPGLSALLGERARIDVSWRPELDFRSGGKFRAVASRA
jgi:phenylacetate-CoA ligase